MIRYEVDVRANGTVERVTKDRRAFAYDLRDVDEAVAQIRGDRRRKSGEAIEVIVIEPDGYRNRLRT